MKRTLGLMLALLLFAAAGMFAQDPVTSTGTSTTTSSTTTSTSSTTTSSTAGTYYLRDAYPKLKTLLKQEILLIGLPQKDARINVWITLTDGGYSIPVLKNFNTVVSLGFFKSKVQLKGMFISHTKLGYVFEATGYKTL